MDADRDGKLTREEMQRPRADRPNAAPRQDDGAGMRQGDGAGMRQTDRPRRSPFDRLDADRDGFVSRAEFNAGSERIFARCDKDGDGRITRGECRPGDRAQAGSAPRRDAPTQ
jgi:Ca2+-binding EF-hand superfamily protein